MKCLKTVLFFLICLLLACNNEDKAGGEKSFLVIHPADLVLHLSAQENERFYTVKSDEVIRVSSNNPSWCKPVISNVSIDNLKIKILENETFQNRVAVIEVSNQSESINLTINQAGTQPVLSVDKKNVVVQFGKSEFTLEINSNFKINFELPDWISQKDDNSWQKGKKKYAFILSELKEDMTVREGKIIIKPIDESLEMQAVSISVIQKAIPKIIAHRGYWEVPTYPQNSLASLQRAIDLEIYGSELDVWVTKDGVVVLSHDATINGLNVENSNYSDLKDVKLTNGESIPTLGQCIEIVKKQKKTKLIVEIKPHSTTVNEDRAVAAVLKLVNYNEVEDLIDYISFSENICEGLIANNSKNRVAYLNGNITPDILKKNGYWGLDYSANVLKINLGWIQTAKKINLLTNVWTINNPADFEYFISNDIDFITTDYPQNLKNLLSNK